MATLKQIEANRRNALLSTGPKTPEGKAAVRLNASVTAFAHRRASRRERRGLSATLRRSGSRMAAANADLTALCRTDGGLAMETEAHGNRRNKSLGTKVRRQKPDPAAGPALASGVPPGALFHQSTTGTRAAPKIPAQANLRAAGRSGAGAAT